jgi:hypothetical protein
MRLRAAPNPQSSSCAGDGASSFLSSRILQRFCKRSFGSPRLPASPAPPPIETPGCPSSSIFRLAYGESSGCPEGSLLPAWPWAQAPDCPGSRSFWPASGSVSGLPRIPSPLAAPFGGSSGCPKSLTFRCTVSASSGRPNFCVYGCTAPRLQVAPNPVSAAGPMLTSRLNSNFASSTLGRG